jgi:hypothetical protein
MNDDLEQHLRTLRLKSPSAGLDRRMDDLFAGAVNTPATRPGWWFVLMAPLAGVAAALAIFIMQAQRPAPVPATLVCRIEPTGAMREMLVPTTRGALPSLEAVVQMGETFP